MGSQKFSVIVDHILLEEVQLAALVLQANTQKETQELHTVSSVLLVHSVVIQPKYRYLVAVENTALLERHHAQHALQVFLAVMQPPHHKPVQQGLILQEMHQRAMTVLQDRVV